MSNEKQDLINHRLTATACKNYTDKEIKKAKYELKTFFSKNIVNAEDHTNELAYQITAPSGAKLLQLQSIGGNSVKYEPSVASDDTTTLIKTMPSVVYDFDVNKVKGVSEVSENLIVLEDVAETTTNYGITYSVKNGVITLNGTATNNVSIYLELKTDVSIGTYSYNQFGKQAGHNVYLTKNNTSSNDLIVSLNNTTGIDTSITTTELNKYLYTYISNGTTFTNYSFKPMLVKGTTAPTEFKVGYKGIHNNELTGFKVESQNLFPNNSFIDVTKQGITATKQSDGTIKLDGTANGYPTFSIGNIELEAGTYYLPAISTNLYYWIGTSSMGRELLDKQSYQRWSFTLTQRTMVYFSFTLLQGATLNNFIFKPTCIREKSDITTDDYTPYIQPTTIPIDLTSIVDTSGNKLFEDGSLKGINDVYDEITPYKAVKRFGIVDLGTLNWAKNTTNTSGKYRMVSSDLSSLIKATTSDSLIGNILCSKYTTGSANDTWLNNNNVINVDKNKNIHVYDENYQDNVDFKTAMSGVYLVYELATPIEADIDLSQLKNIQGYSNGSITALNTYDMEVPSEIRYNSIIQDTLATSITITRNGVDILTRNLPTITSDGYGVNANAHNLRVFSDYEGNEVNKRYTNVNKNILGDDTWTYDNDYNRFYATIQDFPAVAQRTVDLLANNYTAKTNSEVIDANWDMVIYNSNLINNVYIHDHRYNDATIFKTAKSGEPMYYPLADTSKTETDLDSFDYFFDVEEGDIITFNNPYAQQVYATYSFITKEVKSNE